MKQLALLLASSMVTLSALGASFSQGDLVVYRVGEVGGPALGNSATAAFLDEFTIGGVSQQSIALPTVVNGSNLRLTASGSATSDGQLRRSTDGRYLTMGGYDAALGTASVAGTTAAAVNRVIGLVGADGVVNTTTAINNAWSGNNLRSVVSDDGTRFWGSGNGSSGNGGVFYVGSVGATTATQLSTSVVNTRTIGMFGSQVYVTSASGTFQGVSQVGTGSPTTSGQTISLLPGFPTATGPQPYGFVLADLSLSIAGMDNAWVADDRAISSGGGIQHWIFDGANWNLSYTLGTGSGSTVGARGLTLDLSGANPVIYATTAESAANRIITIVDTGIGSTATTLATAAANTAFRGIDFAPMIPEPSALSLGALALVVIRTLRRRTQA